MQWLRKKVVELAKSDRIAGLFDQGLQSTVKFLALLLFARWLSKDEFGILALAIAMSYTAAGLQRATITLPFIVSCPTVELVRQRGGHWFWLNILLIAVVTALLAVIYVVVLAVDSPEWLRDAIGYSIISVAPIMLYDFTRRWLYQCKEHRTILFMSSVNFISYAVGVAIVYFTVHEVWAAVLALAVANTLGAVAARIGDRPPGLGKARGMIAAWLQTRSFTFWQLLGSFVSQSDSQALKLIVAALIGPAGVAVLTATGSVSRPVGAVTSAVDMIDKPRAGRAYARTGLQGLTKSIRGTQRLLLILGLPYLALLFVFSGEAMGLLYGPKYAEYAWELRLWIATGVVGLLNRPQETKMIMLQLSRQLFVIKLVSGIVTYAVLVVLIGPFGIQGAIASVLIGKIAKQIMLYAAGRKGTAQPATATPPVAPTAAAEQDDARPRGPGELAASSEGSDDEARRVARGG